MGCLLTVSCKKDKARPAFELKYFMEFEIPAGLNTFTFHQFSFQNEESGIQFFLEQNNLDTSDIVSINTSFARLSSILGNEDLSIIDEIVIDVFRPSDPQDNFEAAYTFQIPLRNTNRIQLVPSITNLKEVLQEDFFDLVIHIRFRSIPPRTSPVQLEIGFDVFKK